MLRLFLFIAFILEFQSTMAKLSTPLSLNERVESALNKGIAHFNTGELVDAIVQFELAKSFAEDEGLHYELAEVNNWLGNAYQENGEIAKSLAAYNTALRIAQGYDNELLTNRLLINIGNLEIDLGHYALAQDHFRSAWKFFTFRHDSLYALIASNGLGLALLKDFKLDSAKLLLESSLGIATKLQDTLRMARIYANLGSFYFTKDELEISANYYEKSIACYHALDQTEYTRDLYFDLLKLHLQSAKLDRAKEAMERYHVYFSDVLPRHKPFYYMYQRLRGLEEAESRAKRDGYLIVLLIVTLVVSYAGFSWRWYTRRNPRPNNTQKDVQSDSQKDIHPRADSRAENTSNKETVHNTIRSTLAPISRLRQGNVMRTYNLIPRGYSQKQIALDLGVSEASVSDYVKLIHSKLRIEDIHQHAISLGVLEFSKEEFYQIFELNRGVITLNQS